MGLEIGERPALETNGLRNWRQPRPSKVEFEIDERSAVETNGF